MLPSSLSYSGISNTQETVPTLWHASDIDASPAQSISPLDQTNLFAVLASTTGRS
jgi:hypothetical protein